MAHYNKKIRAYRAGLWAETLAALYLQAAGYRIVKRRYKCRAGEIDLIARKGRVLVIIEVKARRNMRDALEAVSPRNRQRVERAALVFLSQNPFYQDHDMRFDILALALPFSIQHLDNAWQARS